MLCVVCVVCVVVVVVVVQTIENSPCLSRVEPTCKLIQRAAPAASAAT